MIRVAVAVAAKLRTGLPGGLGTRFGRLAGLFARCGQGRQGCEGGSPARFLLIEMLNFWRGEHFAWDGVA